MDLFLDFLTNNYMWFLVITIFLIFSLIGYLVESQEAKKASVYGNYNQGMEQNFEALAASAKNQTLGGAMNQNMQGTMNNQAQNNMVMPNMNGNPSNTSFDVLNK